MKLKIFFLTMVFAGVITSCKDQLDVKNPNEPTASTLLTEKGITKFALAGIYINGFHDLKFYDGVIGYFWGQPFHEIMGDVIGEEAANEYINQAGAAEKVTLDNGTVVPNPGSPSHQPALLRAINLNANQGNNPGFYEWGYMYALNHSANFILANVDAITFSGDQATKVGVLKAWSYWWKGYAYSRIASFYYAGLIIDDPLVTNGDYKSIADMLAEAENNFKKCETALGGLTVNSDYTATLGAIIPDFCQVGKGGVMDPAMWGRNINTLRARNLLVNNPVATAPWDQILTLTTNGIKASDLVFTGRSNGTADWLSPVTGTVAARATGPAAGYRPSERLIQDFQPGDERLANNFSLLPSVWIGNSDRGNIFNTRWQLLDGGKGMAGVLVYSDRSVGGQELYIAGSWEENQLMMAEANMNKGNIDTGINQINAIRTAQGSTVASPAGLNLTAATAQLRSERRVALAFRGLSFYDARRWGVIFPKASGGGRTGAIVVDNSGTVNTNATIDYQFLDYWDVPDNEIAYNPATPGSASTKNPNN